MLMQFFLLCGYTNKYVLSANSTKLCLSIHEIRDVQNFKGRRTRNSCLKCKQKLSLVVVVEKVVYLHFKRSMLMLGWNRPICEGALSRIETSVSSSNKRRRESTIKLDNTQYAAVKWDFHWGNRILISSKIWGNQDTRCIVKALA